MHSLEDVEDWDRLPVKDITSIKQVPLISDDSTGTIKESLDDALRSISAESARSFAHFSSHTDPPNPFILLDKFGYLGLPLSQHAGDAIVDEYAMAESFAVISADKFDITNPAFLKWITAKVLPDMSKTLRVSSISRPVCKRMVILRPGTESLNFHEREDSTGHRLGSLSLFLAAPETSASIQASFDGETLTCTLAPFTTIALGAYCDVHHVIGSLPSHFVVHLEFDLISSSPVLPMRPRDEIDTVGLLEALQRWRNALDNTPTCAPHLLVAVLSEAYGGGVPVLSASQLVGADRNTLLLLAPLAKAYGFELHFAETTYAQSCMLEVEQRSYTYTEIRWGDYLEDDYLYDDVDADQLEMKDDKEENVTFEEVSAMDGTPMDIVGSELELIHDKCLETRFVLNSPMEGTEFSAEWDLMEQRTGTLIHAYRFTSLLISPVGSSRIKFTLEDD